MPRTKRRRARTFSVADYGQSCALTVATNYLNYGRFQQTSLMIKDQSPLMQSLSFVQSLGGSCGESLVFWMSCCAQSFAYFFAFKFFATKHQQEGKVRMRSSAEHWLQAFKTGQTNALTQEYLMGCPLPRCVRDPLPLEWLNIWY